MLQIGGFSELSGDVGNGHWIATEAFRIIYDEICLKKRESLVLRYFSEQTGVKDKDGLLMSLIKIQGLEREKYIRILIDAFFFALNKYDEAALEVADVMAKRGADFICGHLRHMEFDQGTINIVLSGSIHTKLPSDVYINKLKEVMASRSEKSFNYIKLDKKPVIGCINWIIEKAENKE